MEEDVGIGGNSSFFKFLQSFAYARLISLYFSIASAFSKLIAPPTNPPPEVLPVAAAATGGAVGGGAPGGGPPFPGFGVVLGGAGGAPGPPGGGPPFPGFGAPGPPGPPIATFLI